MNPLAVSWRPVIPLKVLVVALSALFACHLNGQESVSGVVAKPDRSITAIGPRHWDKLSRVDLSPDGKWLAYGSAVRGEPSSRDGYIVVQEVAGNSKRVFPAPGGREALFAADSKSVYIAIRGRDGMVVTGYELPGFREFVTFRNPREMEVAYAHPDVLLLKGCNEIVLSRAKTIRPDDDELIAFSSTTRRLARYENVDSFHPSRNFDSIACVSTTDDHGWELSIIDVQSKNVGRLVSGRGKIRSLSWSDDNTSLAYIRFGRKKAASVSLWSNVGGENPGCQVFSRETTADWPDDLVLDRDVEPHVAMSGKFVGLTFRSRSASVGSPSGKDDDPKAPTVWKTSDFRLPTERDDINFHLNYFATGGDWKASTHCWNVETNTLIELTGSPENGVVFCESGSIALVRDQTPHASLRSRTSFFSDMTAVDLKSRQRQEVATQVPGMNRVAPSISPSGRFVVIHDDRGWTFHNVINQTSRSIAVCPIAAGTQRVDSQIPFRAKWLSGEAGFLIGDRTDVWKVPVDASQPTIQLTDGEASGRRYSFEEESEDGSLYFSFEDIKTKFTGIAVYREKKLIDLLECQGSCDFDSFALGGGNVCIAHEQHNAAGRIAVVNELTGKVVCQSELRTGTEAADHTKRELIGYDSPWGERLHATLVYPENYTSDRKWPMIVIVYRRASVEHHQFDTAASNSYLSPASWAKKGYFVLKPDMAAMPGDPGRSAVRCLNAAMDRVADVDSIDMDRVAIMGVSHGGYQTLMALCSTDRFAAGVAVNALTDLATHSVDLYDEDGESNLGHVLFARMQVPFWKDPQRYISNSPLYLVDGMNTPLLLGVGRRDKNVHWRQSLYFFNALRAAGKPAQMVVYPTAGHGFAFDAFRRRVNQFLDRILQP